MEAARPALWTDTVASAVIVVVAGNLFHEGFKGLQLSGCHVAHFCFISFPRRTAVICKRQIIPAFGQQKKRVCFMLRFGE